MSEEVKEIVQVETADESLNTEKISEGTNEEIEAIEANVDEEATLINPEDEDLLNEENMRQLSLTLKSLEGTIKTMESLWLASASELSLKDEHMRQISMYNDKYKTPAPEGMTDEERSEWDYLNGIDKMTDEDIESIFEEGHPIYGVDHSQTIDRIKGAAEDFFNWLTSIREYRNIHDAYLKLLEMQEEENMNKLREAANKEPDEQKKQFMIEQIELYYKRKNLGFLADEIDEFTKNKILSVLTDEKKAEYYINRCRDKLNQLKISNKIILEISQFEKRFLEEKYHKCSQVLLTYFMSTCIFTDMAKKEDEGRIRTICMVMALDSIIRNTINEEKKNIIHDNIRKLEDQFINNIEEVKKDE